MRRGGRREGILRGKAGEREERPLHASEGHSMQLSKMVALSECAEGRRGGCEEERIGERTGK